VIGDLKVLEKGKGKVVTVLN